MAPGSPCSVGCQMCLDFSLPLLKPCLSAASLFRLGGSSPLGYRWVDGRPVSECTWLERGAAEARRLAPRPGPRSGGDEPIAVPPDFVSLPVFGTLGFPPSHGQLHSWHEGVKSTCALQPIAMRSAFAASPDWRTHRVGGRRGAAASPQGCV